MQSSVTTVTATANATAMSNDWSNVMGTLLSSNWSKLAPAAVQNFGMFHNCTHNPNLPLSTLVTVNVCWPSGQDIT